MCQHVSIAVCKYNLMMIQKKCTKDTEYPSTAASRACPRLGVILYGWCVDGTIGREWFHGNNRDWSSLQPCPHSGSIKHLWNDSTVVKSPAANHTNCHHEKNTRVWNIFLTAFSTESAGWWMECERTACVKSIAPRIAAGLHTFTARVHPPMAFSAAASLCCSALRHIATAPALQSIVPAINPNCWHYKLHWTTTAAAAAVHTGIQYIFSPKSTHTHTPSHTHTQTHTPTQIHPSPSRSILIRSSNSSARKWGLWLD